MISSKITNRYAKALLDLSIEQGVLDKVYNDIIIIDHICLENRDFMTMLKSPIISTAKKTEIIKAIFSKKLSKLSFLFLEIIIKKKREFLLHAIAKNFVKLYKDHNKIISANLITAVPIDSSTRNKIRALVKQSTDFEVELKEKINKEIIGGSVINIGDFQLDSSVKKSLRNLKNSFNKNLYIKDF